MTTISPSLVQLLMFATISDIVVAALDLSWALLFKSSFGPLLSGKKAFAVYYLQNSRQKKGRETMADLNFDGVLGDTWGENSLSAVKGTYLIEGCNSGSARGDQCEKYGKLLNPTELKHPRCKNDMWLSWLPLVVVVEETILFLANMLKVVPIGKVVSVGRNMKEMVKQSFPSFTLNFDKSNTQKFAQKAQVSNTKSTKQEKIRGRFKFCLMLFLVLSTEPKGVASEDIGNPLVHGSTAMNPLAANKNLRGLKLSERRPAATTKNSINYKDFPHWYSQPNSPGIEEANPHERPCNPNDTCRQGNEGKN